MNFIYRHYKFFGLFTASLLYFGLWFFPRQYPDKVQEAADASGVFGFILGVLCISIMRNGIDYHNEKNGWIITLNRTCRRHVLWMRQYLEQPSVFVMVIHSIALHRELLNVIKNKQGKVFVEEHGVLKDASDTILLLPKV